METVKYVIVAGDPLNGMFFSGMEKADTRCYAKVTYSFEKAWKWNNKDGVKAFKSVVDACTNTPEGGWNICSMLVVGDKCITPPKLIR